MIKNFKKFIRRMNQMSLEHSLEISSLIGIIFNLNYLKQNTEFCGQKITVISDKYIHVLVIKVLLYASRINKVNFLNIKSNDQFTKSLKTIKSDNTIIILYSCFVKYHFILNEIKRRDNFFVI